MSSPPTHWDESARPPGTIRLLIQASGSPIEHYSYEVVELSRNKQARWQSLRRLRQSAAFVGNQDPAMADELKGPDLDSFAIDASFAALRDNAEFDYRNSLPTTFVLSGEAVDCLRAAAGTIIMASPEFRRLLKDVGVRFVAEPPTTGGPAAAY
jgi:NTE family protein